MNSRFRILREMPVRNTDETYKLIRQRVFSITCASCTMTELMSSFKMTLLDLNNCEEVFQNGVNGYSEEENSFSLRKIVV